MPLKPNDNVHVGIYVNANVSVNAKNAANDNVKDGVRSEAGVPSQPQPQPKAELELAIERIARHQRAPHNSSLSTILTVTLATALLLSVYVGIAAVNAGVKATAVAISLSRAR